MYEPKPDMRPVLSYDGNACPEGSSPENPLRLDQPEGNWMYVCLPTRPWAERATKFLR